jgi:hypothetical protein
MLPLLLLPPPSLLLPPPLLLLCVAAVRGCNPTTCIAGSMSCKDTGSIS